MSQVSEEAQARWKAEWDAHEQELVQNFYSIKVPRVAGRRVCTPRDCDAFARRLLNTTSEDIRRVDNQGSSSYTLICDSQSKIIQFRIKPFDPRTMQTAHQIYGDISPEVDHYSNFALPVYVSKVLPGKVHVLRGFRARDNFPLEREKRTVTDLAEVIAKSAHYPRSADAYTDTSWTKSAKSTLTFLMEYKWFQSIAPEVVEKIRSVYTQLDLLNQLPAVLTHHDLTQLNIFVNEAGAVTGIVDFDKAEYEALGMCIFGLYECFVGSMENRIFSFHNFPAKDGSGKTVRQVLESAFWDTFWAKLPAGLERKKLEAPMRVAIDVGIINRYFHPSFVNTTGERALSYADGILLGRE